jgi:hypothetical protein
MNRYSRLHREENKATEAAEGLFRKFEFVGWRLSTPAPIPEHAEIPHFEHCRTRGESRLLKSLYIRDRQPGTSFPTARREQAQLYWPHGAWDVRGRPTGPVEDSTGTARKYSGGRHGRSDQGFSLGCVGSLRQRRSSASIGRSRENLNLPLSSRKSATKP